MTASRHRPGSIGIGRTVVVMLLALLWVQLGVAAHQFDHVASDGSEYCDLCQQLDRSDNALAPVAAGAPLALHSEAAPRCGARASSARTAPGYQSRAPPFI